MPTETPAARPPDEFVRSLGECGVTALADLRPAAGRLAPGVLDGVALAREMVEAGQLTAYQAAAVLERRFADLTVGNYEILDRIGAGGMGTVYKARHRELDRHVAIKVCLPGGHLAGSSGRRSSSPSSGRRTSSRCSTSSGSRPAGRCS